MGCPAQDSAQRGILLPHVPGTGSFARFEVAGAPNSKKGQGGSVRGRPVLPSTPAPAPAPALATSNGLAVIRGQAELVFGLAEASLLWEHMCRERLMAVVAHPHHTGLRGLSALRLLPVLEDWAESMEDVGRVMVGLGLGLGGGIGPGWREVDKRWTGSDVESA
ncbi:hypothetical protein ARSEF1564_003326 [Beauveria bassiana]